MQSNIQESSHSSSSQRSILASIICDKCPHYCEIPKGATGKCLVISNNDGRLENSYSDRCAAIAVESIEKRPLFHVLPGTKFLSVGFYGCNFSCDFCQNFRISQRIGKAGSYYSPCELVQLALERGTKGIAFTYNEPVLYHEYIEEVGHEIGRGGYPLKLVVKTNGFVHPSVIRTICLYADAVNVDIKGDENDYAQICKGSLEPVIECLDWILGMGTHLEISYLVLPSKLDNLAFNIYFRNWLSDINAEIPLHLLCFYPFNRMLIPSYSPEKLVPLAKLFREKMKYVYISNHYGEKVCSYRNTCCSRCGKTLIDRHAKTTLHSLSCCELNLPGIFS